MRFLFFSAQYLPTAGGVERFTAELGRSLVGMGHAVTVVTSALPGLPAREGDADGLCVWRLPARLFMKGRFPTLRKNTAFRRMAAELWREPFDFALINTRFYPLSAWAARQCAVHGVPALVLEHGTKHLSLENPFLNALGNAYEHAMMKRVCRYCGSIYGISQASVAWLRHFKVEAAGVLYNAVDAAAIGAIAENPSVDFRQKFGLAKKTPLISFVGRFIVEKGVEELLAGFALLRTRLPGARLAMVGGGPLFARVQAQAPEGVLLCGQLPHAETVALMAQSDVFCLPTYSEGFSSTILEAAAAGCCIVTTPTGGSPELISDQKSGILLKDIRPETLCEILAAVLGSSGFRKSAGRLACQTVAQRFTWQATAQRLLEIANNSAAE